jgi:hypothetical protein
MAVATAFRAGFLFPERQPARNLALAIALQALCSALSLRTTPSPKGGMLISPRALHAIGHFASVAISGKMLVYLFRQKRNGDVAVTADVTGRNLPPDTPDSHWVFVEVIDTEKTRLPLGIVDLNEAFSRVRGLGYYIF